MFNYQIQGQEVKIIMDNNRILWGIVAILGMLCPTIGIVIGSIKYKRDGSKIRKIVKEEYRNAQKVGGVKSLYYKHEHKRVFAKTFGVPTVVGLIVGLILMCIAFHNM